MSLPDYKVNGRWIQGSRQLGRMISTVSGYSWCNINSRCGNRDGRCPSYITCTNDFTDFQEFAEWHVSQVGYGKGWQLDKDILIKGNKSYSPSTCILLPRELNVLFTKRKSHRGEYPIGVKMRSGRFPASITSGSVSQHIGTYDTPLQAFLAYKVRKESVIKALAVKWKGQIDPKAYNALLAYEVEITD